MPANADLDQDSIAMIDRMNATLAGMTTLAAAMQGAVDRITQQVAQYAAWMQTQTLSDTRMGEHVPSLVPVAPPVVFAPLSAPRSPAAPAAPNGYCAAGRAAKWTPERVALLRSLNGQPLGASAVARQLSALPGPRVNSQNIDYVRRSGKIPSVHKASSPDRVPVKNAKVARPVHGLAPVSSFAIGQSSAVKCVSWGTMLGWAEVNGLRLSGDRSRDVNLVNDRRLMLGLPRYVVTPDASVGAMQQAADANAASVAR